MLNCYKIKHFSKKFFKKKKGDFLSRKIVNSKRSYKSVYIQQSLSFVFFRVLLLVGIKYQAHEKHLGLFKNAYGSLFFLQLASGIYIGDLVKNTLLHLNYSKKFVINSVNFIGFLFEYFFVFCLKIKHSHFITVFASANGTFCQIFSIISELNLVLISLPSKKKLYVSCNTLCYVGRSANTSSKYKVIGGAGYFASFGKKPVVRGVAKNPVDHPHGGRTKTNSPETSPWGWVTKHNH